MRVIFVKNTETMEEKLVSSNYTLVGAICKIAGKEPTKIIVENDDYVSCLFVTEGDGFFTEKRELYYAKYWDVVE